MSVYSTRAVRDYSEASGAAYVLLLMIADGVDANYGANRAASVAILARQAHFHAWDADSRVRANARRRVNRLLNDLVARGELIVFDSAGGKQKNEYVIPILLGEPGYAPRPCDPDEATHSCNGYHTPLTVNREQLATDERDRRKRAVAQSVAQSFPQPKGQKGRASR